MVFLAGGLNKSVLDFYCLILRATTAALQRCGDALTCYNMLCAIRMCRAANCYVVATSSDISMMPFACSHSTVITLGHEWWMLFLVQIARYELVKLGSSGLTPLEPIKAEAKSDL